MLNAVWRFRCPAHGGQEAEGGDRRGCGGGALALGGQGELMGWHLGLGGMSVVFRQQSVSLFPNSPKEGGSGHISADHSTLSNENLKHTAAPTLRLSLPAPYGSVLLVATGLDAVATGPVAPISSRSAAVAAPDLAAAIADDFATAL